MHECRRRSHAATVRPWRERCNGRDTNELASAVQATILTMLPNRGTTESSMVRSPPPIPQCAACLGPCRSPPPHTLRDGNRAHTHLLLRCTGGPASGLSDSTSRWQAPPSMLSRTSNASPVTDTPAAACRRAWQQQGAARKVSGTRSPRKRLQVAQVAQVRERRAKGGEGGGASQDS